MEGHGRLTLTFSILDIWWVVVVCEWTVAPSTIVLAQSNSGSGLGLFGLGLDWELDVTIIKLLLDPDEVDGSRAQQC